MAAMLLSPDHQRVLKILQDLAAWRSETSRVALMEAALGGEPRGMQLLAQLDLSGAPRDAAAKALFALQQFGHVAYHRSALGAVLNEVLIRVGLGSDSEFLRDLFIRYPFDGVLVASAPIDSWRDEVSAAEVDERIIGENTLRHVRVLAQAFEAARAVVRISVGNSVGSGFMCASDVVMTNNHVIRDRQEAAHAEFTFNYQLGPDGRELQTQSAKALTDGLFHTNAELDFTLVQLADVPDFGLPLRLKAAVVERDSRLSIIQHPAGGLKKIAMENNIVAYADRTIVQYYTSTEPGSSGSPVFDDDCLVVAIHHAGGLLREPSTGRRFLRNEGVSMVAILNALTADAPDLAQLLGA